MPHGSTGEYQKPEKVIVSYILFFNETLITTYSNFRLIP